MDKKGCSLKHFQTLIFVFGILLTAISIATAQDEPKVQEFTGTIDSDHPRFFYDLFGLEAGQIVYLYAEATSDDLDTYIGIGDIEFEEVFAENDDYSLSSTNSALEYRIEEAGDYSVIITRYDDSTSGDYRFLIGINAPDVLTGNAEPTGHEIALLYDEGDVELEATDCSTLEERPELSGPEQIRETENFVIHYTDKGRDGATRLFVDEVEKVMEEVLAIQIDQMGWPLPPSDCGEGGDERFDVYLMELLSENTLGYAQPESLIVDNPDTPETETYAAYSHLVLDNDFVGISDRISVMRATAAHEFNHAIQFGYDLSDAVHWYYEATAVWLETQTFPDDEDATPYVVELFDAPDVCIGSLPAEDSLRYYAEWIFIDSLARDHGVKIVPDLWKEIAESEGMEPFYDVLEKYDTTPQEVVKRFAIRNLLLDYELADRFYARVHVESNVNGVGEVAPRQSGVQELAVDYLFITRLGQYTFSIDQPNLELIVVGIDQQNDEARVFEIGQEGTVDTTPFSRAYVIVLNTDTFEDPDNCTATDWTLTVEDGASAATFAKPADEVFNAAKFIPAG